MTQSNPATKLKPSDYADALGTSYAIAMSQEHKKLQGQFFTPVSIASFMAGLSDFQGKRISILDPGCGSAVLSCALVEQLIVSNVQLEQITLVVYENDLQLIETTEQSLTYLKEWAASKMIHLDVKIIKEDFILCNADQLKSQQGLFESPANLFDIVISNPPYFKLSIEDKRAVAGKDIINGHPNIYALFMALAAKLLKPGGELIFITPRSFASGGYFKLFRKFFFNLIELAHLHLFVSRKDTFSRDKVLQETLIMKGIRKDRIDLEKEVTVSTSSGLKDLEYPETRLFPLKDIINVSSGEGILFLPTSDFDESILEIFKAWKGSLAAYQIKVSTGPVVAFRAKDLIQEETPENIIESAPLLWLHNVKQMALEYPVFKPGKGQYILVKPQSASILLPNKDYILLRRFSSKDDKARLIATPYFSRDFDAPYIGIENKVNYFYRPNGVLQESEIFGLAALLNSSLFDAYFRIFNGNVNVSATELRNIPLPPLEDIIAIGQAIAEQSDLSMENTQRIVEHYFESMIMA